MAGELLVSMYINGTEADNLSSLCNIVSKNLKADSISVFDLSGNMISPVDYSSNNYSPADVSNALSGKSVKKMRFEGNNLIAYSVQPVSVNGETVAAIEENIS